MRTATLAVLLAFTACATTEQKPVETAPARAEPAQADAAKPAGLTKLDIVEFASPAGTQAGGEVSDTKYSEKPDDVAITKKSFANGVVTYEGQVGFGKGSQWAGIGLFVNILPDAKPTDAKAYGSVTFRLASPTTGTLRLRIVGPDVKIKNAGCYPIYMQPVTKELTEYTVPIAKFVPESWCAAQARTADATIGALTGFEIADIALRKEPTTFSIGTITLNP